MRSGGGGSEGDSGAEGVGMRGVASLLAAATLLNLLEPVRGDLRRAQKIVAAMRTGG